MININCNYKLSNQSLHFTGNKICKKSNKKVAIKSIQNSTSLNKIEKTGNIIRCTMKALGILLGIPILLIQQTIKAPMKLIRALKNKY